MSNKHTDLQISKEEYLELLDDIKEMQANKMQDDEIKNSPQYKTAAHHTEKLIIAAAIADVEERHESAKLTSEDRNKEPQEIDNDISIADVIDDLIKNEDGALNVMKDNYDKFNKGIKYTREEMSKITGVQTRSPVNTLKKLNEEQQLTRLSNADHTLQTTTKNQGPGHQL